MLPGIVEPPIRALTSSQGISMRGARFYAMCTQLTIHIAFSFNLQRDFTFHGKDKVAH